MLDSFTGSAVRVGGCGGHGGAGSGGMAAWGWERGGQGGVGSASGDSGSWGAGMARGTLGAHPCSSVVLSSILSSVGLARRGADPIREANRCPDICQRTCKRMRPVPRAGRGGTWRVCAARRERAAGLRAARAARADRGGGWRERDLGRGQRQGARRRVRHGWAGTVQGAVGTYPWR